MADRTLTVKIGANVQGLVSSLRTAQQATSQFAEKTQQGILRNRDSINTLSGNVGLLGGALTAVVGVAVSRFADFDAAMSSVQAATMESAGNMDLLREAALDAGQETAFSATEAAAAIEELSKAGVSTTDILNGGLSGALNLAASDNIAVAEAAEIAASAMTQFGLAGDDVTHIADLLAAGAAEAQGGVSDLGQALNQSGLVASQFGLDIDETVGTLSAFASAGLTGSDAGTSFRAMLLRLANPTEEVKNLMAELGLEAYDAQGNFVGMSQFAGNLQTSLEGMTQAQRDQTLAMVFGQDAIRTANILMTQGADGIETWIDAVDQQGFAASQAGIQMDNLKGDVEQLTGSLETAFINAGEGGNAALRELVQSATSTVNSFSALPDAVQEGTLAIAGTGGLVLLGVAGLGKMSVATAEAIEAMQRMGAISEGTAGKMRGIGVAAGKAAATAGALYGLVSVLDMALDSSDKVVAGLEETTSALLGLQDANFDSLFAGLGSDFDDFGGAVELLTDGGLNGKMERFGSSLNGIFFGGRLQDQVKDAREQMSALGDALGAMVAAGDADEAARMFDDLAVAAEEQGVSVEELQELMPGYTEALAGAANAQELTAEQTAATTGAVEEQTDVLQDNIDMQREAAGVVLDVREAQREYEAAIDDVASSLDRQREELIEQEIANGLSREAAERAADATLAQRDALDITTAAGRDNQAALDSIAASGYDLIDSMRANGASQVDLQGKMESTREDFIRVAESMGMSADEASALADQMGLIPSEINTDVTVNGLDEAQRSINRFITDNDGRRIRVYTDSVGDTSVYTGPGNMIARATGGPVFGAGSGTSDSILARLSNGEHVWTAREVAAAGGHGAISAMRQMVLAGSVPQPMGYATGGPVMLQQGYAPTITVAGGASRTYAPVIHNQQRPLTSRDVVDALRLAEMLEV